MTVSTTGNSISYAGDGVTTVFAFPYQFLAETDLVVTERIIATGVDAVKTLGTHYTVTGGDGASGSVVAASAPASTVRWTITRVTEKTQPIDYSDNDAFPAQTHERGLDRATMIAQDAGAGAARNLRFPETDAPSLSAVIPSSAERAGRLASYDVNGEPSVTALGELGVETIITPVEVVNGGTGASSASQARSILEVPGLADENAFTKTQTWPKGADVASANALTLGSDGNYFDITGTTAITSIATVGVGTVVKLHFDGALVLTHHSTDLVLPGGANITTAAGDEAEFIEYATGDWRCTSYVKASGDGILVDGFSKQLYHIRDQKTAGTAGGTFTSGSFVKRDLQTELTTEITGASLASSVITLPAGRYYMEASAPGHSVGQHVAKLRNTSDSTDTLIGTAEQVAPDANSAQTRSFISGRFTIAAAKTFEIQHRCSSTFATSGLGNPCNFGVVEVYTDVRIWKIS